MPTILIPLKTGLVYVSLNPGPVNEATSTFKLKPMQSQLNKARQRSQETVSSAFLVVLLLYLIFRSDVSRAALIKALRPKASE